MYMDAPVPILSHFTCEQRPVFNMRQYLTHSQTYALSSGQCHCRILKSLLHHDGILQQQLQLIDLIQIEGKPVVSKAVHMHADFILRQEGALLTIMLPAADMDNNVSSGGLNFLDEALLHDSHFCTAQGRPNGRLCQVHLHVQLDYLAAQESKDGSTSPDAEKK